MLNKKGYLSDAFFAGVVLFIVAILFVIVNLVINQFWISMNNTSVGSDTTTQQILALGQDASNASDIAAIMIFVGLILVSMIGGYYVNTTPILMVFGVLLLAVFMLVVPQISNAYETFEDQAVIQPYAANFPLTSALIGNLPIAVAVSGFLIMIAMYVGSKREAGFA